MITETETEFWTVEEINRMDEVEVSMPKRNWFWFETQAEEAKEIIQSRRELTEREMRTFGEFTVGHLPYDYEKNSGGDEWQVRAPRKYFEVIIEMVREAEVDSLVGKELAMIEQHI